MAYNIKVLLDAINKIPGDLFGGFVSRHNEKNTIDDLDLLLNNHYAEVIKVISKDRMAVIVDELEKAREKNVESIYYTTLAILESEDNVFDGFVNKYRLEMLILMHKTGFCEKFIEFLVQYNKKVLVENVLNIPYVKLSESEEKQIWDEMLSKCKVKILYNLSDVCDSIWEVSDNTTKFKELIEDNIELFEAVITDPMLPDVIGPDAVQFIAEKLATLQQSDGFHNKRSKQSEQEPVAPQTKFDFNPLVGSIMDFNGDDKAFKKFVISKKEVFEAFMVTELAGCILGDRMSVVTQVLGKKVAVKVEKKIVEATPAEIDLMIHNMLAKFALSGLNVALEVEGQFLQFQEFLRKAENVELCAKVFLSPLARSQLELVMEANVVDSIVEYFEKVMIITGVLDQHARITNAPLDGSVHYQSLKSQIESEMNDACKAMSDSDVVSEAKYKQFCAKQYAFNTLLAIMERINSDFSPNIGMIWNIGMISSEVISDVNAAQSKNLLAIIERINIDFGLNQTMRNDIEMKAADPVPMPDIVYLRNEELLPDGMYASDVGPVPHSGIQMLGVILPTLPSGGPLTVDDDVFTLSHLLD